VNVPGRHFGAHRDDSHDDGGQRGGGHDAVDLGWYELARQCGIRVHDEHGDIRPDIDEAITRTVIAAIWFGITAGYLTMTGAYHIPRKYLADV
jgi:hypothetical protein